MKIIVDTREQLPAFTGNVVRKKLLVGDYSTILLENSFCIERKSGIDLYGSVLQGHVRFRKELVRATMNKIKLVVYVECSRKDFELKKFPGGAARKVEGKIVLKIIDTMFKRHKVEVVWSSTRQLMMKKIILRLKREESSISSLL